MGTMRNAAIAVITSLVLLPSVRAAPTRPVVGKIRIAIPFAGFQAGAVTRLDSSYGKSSGTEAKVANVTFAGASLALELRERFLFEGGYYFLLEHYRVGFSAGLLFVPLDRSQGGRGWVLEVPILLGYHYHHGGTFGSDAYSYERAHYLTLASGLDATYWFRRHLGLTTRLLATALVRFAGRTYVDSSAREEFRGGVGLGLELGLAF
jgi:hypothetical protein